MVLTTGPFFVLLSVKKALSLVGWMDGCMQTKVVGGLKVQLGLLEIVKDDGDHGVLVKASLGDTVAVMDAKRVFGEPQSGGRKKK